MLSASRFPSVLEAALSEMPLAIAALGGCIGYLRELKLDRQLISCGNFRLYRAISQASQYLILDAQTLANLEILQNTVDRSKEGTLLKTLDRCSTPFGKRFFRKLLCNPFADAATIEDRLNALDDLKSDGALLGAIATRLTALPDLERVIARVHTGAVQLAELMTAWKGLADAQDLMDQVWEAAVEFKSVELKRIVCVGDGFPDVKRVLASLEETFDRAATEKAGAVVAHAGFDPVYDSTMQQLAQVESELQEHLFEVRTMLKCSTVEYHHASGKPYQLVVPKSAVPRSTPSGWSTLSETAKLNRYYTSTVSKLLPTLYEAQDGLKDVAKSLLLRLCARFDEHYTLWARAVECLAELDVFCNFANIALHAANPMSRPKFVHDQGAVLRIRQMWHPCIAGSVAQFVPNDVTLGGERPQMMLITGPNMGGKSTTLRQVCLAVIMAQMGCYVPAEEMELSLCDRIFTRLGANDNIVKGMSTFMVELQETSNMLRNASKNSLVIVDELGRGTSTFDGYAIVYSVVNQLASQIRCRALFSTHYHMLCDEFADNPFIAMAHMGCFVDEEKRDVTFLYQLQDGFCPKSYGMHVANMAGLQREVVDRADVVAQEFENSESSLQFRLRKVQPEHLVNRLLAKRIICNRADGDIGDLMKMHALAQRIKFE